VRKSSGLARSTVTIGLALAAWSVLVPSASAGTNGSARPTAPAAPLATDWPQFRNTNDRVGLNTSESVITTASAPNMSLKWSYMTAGSVYSSPVISGSVVYFGSDDKKVYALDTSNGSLKWSYTTGDLVRSPPAVVSGVVYVGSDDNNVYALNAITGAKIWSYATGDDIELSSPLVANGKVYVGSLDGNVYALDQNTGAKVWSVNTWAARGSFAISGTTVYVGSDQSKLYALDADTGATKWTATTGGRIKNTPAISGGVVYVGADDGHVYAWDATTGALKWNTDLSSQCGIVRSTPAVYGGEVYVVTAETCPMDAHFHALDVNTGTEVCNHGMADYATSSVAIANDVAFVGSYSHQLYAFNVADCSKLWDSGFTLMSGGVPSSPAISDGVVYVGSLDNGMYSFTPSSTPVSTFISIKDNLYSPATVIAHDIGTAARWTNNGTKSHNVVDNQGMSLYNSGTIAKGATWEYTFIAAGIYKYYCTLHTSMTGTIKAPVILTPTSGGLSTVFTVQWATAPPPSGFVYDVQIRRPGSTAWVMWKSDVTTTSATFVADSGKGSYDFKAHIQKVSNGKSANYSAFKTIVVS
jgi:outer membrane protein assembly factor BamB